MLLGQFSVTFKYPPGSQHANANGLTRQCGQCLRPDCPVGPPDPAVVETSSTSAMTDQPFAESAMGDSMDTDLLPEMSCETWVATVHLDEATGHLTRLILILIWLLCLSQIKLWWSFGTGYKPVHLRPGQNVHVCHRSSAHGDSNLEIYPWTLPVDFGHWVFIKRYHDSVFAGHLGVSLTVCRLLDCVYWLGLREYVRSYLASCSVCLARKSPCPRRSPMGHVSIGHRWDRVAMDILDMSVSTERGNHYLLVIVDCFSRWTEACPLPNKTAIAIADTFFQLIICRSGIPTVIHSDQGREFENHLMQELCLFLGTRPHDTISSG